MVIYLLDGDAFVSIDLKHSNLWICIGTRAEVEEANVQELVDMINKALAVAKFRNLKTEATQ